MACVRAWWVILAAVSSLLLVGPTHAQGSGDADNCTCAAVNGSVVLKGAAAVADGSRARPYQAVMINCYPFAMMARSGGKGGGGSCPSQFHAHTHRGTHNPRATLFHTP